MYKNFITPAVVLWSITAHVFASQPGTLDTTFNPSGPQPGTVSTTIADIFNNDSARGVVIQPDGKIVAAGDAIGDGYFVAIARFNSDGTLDTTFNTAGPQQGTVTTTIDNKDLTNVAYSIALQADGKIVVAGTAASAGFDQIYRFAVARFNTDGTLDTTFNTAGPQQGTVTTTIDGVDFDNEGYAVALQPDGKIVVAGYAIINDTSKFALARFNADGTLDETFNTEGPQKGTVTTTIDGVDFDNAGYSMALQPDGKIVVAGYARIDGILKFALARFNADGTLDETFNTEGPQKGTVTTTIVGQNSYSEAYSIALQDDGKIVVAGDVDNSQCAIARFNSNGTLDTTFNALGGKPGTAVTTINHLRATAYSVAIQANGKIILGGIVHVDGFQQFAVARFNSDGTLDSTFNPTGAEPGTAATKIDNLTGYTIAFSVALQSDEQIVLAGSVSSYGNGSKFAVARFNGGSPNTVPNNLFVRRLIAKYGTKL